MNWFLAKLIFIIEQEEASSAPQFDEQLRLVQAKDLAEALEKAAFIALKEEQEFFNEKGDLVSWKFLGITELLALGQLVNGKELYSLTPEGERAGDYIRYVKQRSIDLQRALMKLQEVV